MVKFHQGEYRPKNPKKYVGNKFPIYRSSWELTFFRVCDMRSDILKWASELISIPYIDPFTGMIRKYIPDFLIQYIDKNGKIHTEVIEIKPISQTLEEYARTKKDKMSIQLNKAKWQAAQEFCARNNMTFRVMTEKQLYASKR